MRVDGRTAQRSNPVADPRQYGASKKVKPDETQFGTMLHALQERAKELNCLYQVGELLSQSTDLLRRFSAASSKSCRQAGNTRTTVRLGLSLRT